MVAVGVTEATGGVQKNHHPPQNIFETIISIVSTTICGFGKILVGSDKQLIRNIFNGIPPCEATTHDFYDSCSAH